MSIYDSLMSEKIDSLALALSKAQGVIGNVGKDKQGYGYKYADLASCLDAIKKPLSDNGLAIVQLSTQDEDKKQVLITTLCHESGQWISSVFPIESVELKQGNTLQHLGAGLTYIRRYALAAIIGLAQEDADGKTLNKTVQRVEIKESVSKALVLSKKFMELCKKSGIENTRDVVEFAAFAGVNSEDPVSIESAIENFESFKISFWGNQRLSKELVLGDKIL